MAVVFLLDEDEVEDEEALREPVFWVVFDEAADETDGEEEVVVAVVVAVFVVLLVLEPLLLEEVVVVARISLSLLSNFLLFPFENIQLNFFF